MAVRFVIGRAGTGKTALCAREIREEMARDPLGPPLLWITPEQATFSTERLLLTQGGITGTFRAQVLSFRRLAMLIARDSGLLKASANGSPEPLGQIARIVLLEEILRREREKLTAFRTVAQQPGFVRQLDRTLRELRLHGHSGTTLRAFLAEAPAGGLDRMTAEKMQDLALLLDAWSTEADGAGAYDFEHLLHTAALHAGKSPLIVGAVGTAGARVWVDAFSALSTLEIRMLVALGQHARSLTITLLADPDAPAMRDMRETRPADEDMHAGLFSRTERLHRRLVDTFRAHQVPIERTTALRERHRFASTAIARIESSLFEEASSPATEIDGGVEIWECGDPETEVRAAARAIREMAVGAGHKLRYRQIGVLVPNLEDSGDYRDAIARIFAEHGIPHFIDQRRTIAHHPLIELLRAAVAIVTSNFDRDEMLLFLKTNLTGIAEDDVALIENYLIEHGITRIAWEQPWTWLAPNQEEENAHERLPQSARERLTRVNAIRENVWMQLRTFVEQCRPDAPTDGATFIRALRKLLNTLGIETRMEQWIDAARQSGDPELAQIHEQALREIEQLLDLLETLLDGRARSLVETQHLLNSALQQLTLGLIPPTVDQVLVSSVERSRMPDVEVAFILGAIEGQFPRVGSEDSILSDAQREFFNAHATNPIADGTDRQFLEMPFFDYVAMTRARRKLIVSYPICDRQRKALGPSRYVREIRALLGKNVIENTFASDGGIAAKHIATTDDLLSAVNAWARRRLAPAAKDSVAQDDLLPALYNWLAEVGEPRASARRRVWRAIAGNPVPSLSAPMAERFYPPRASLRLSVSQLEKYAACPLQYFLHYTLGLRPREKMQLDAMGIGTLLHRVLERVYIQIIDGNIDWPQCGEASLRALLEQEVNATVEELHGEIAQRTPGYEKTRRRTIRVLGAMLEADRRRACVGSLRPVAVELFFGTGNAPREGPRGRLISLPVLALDIADQRTLQLNGKIDRMDSSEDGLAAVVDYKSSVDRTLALREIFHGISLQLPTYALVMRELATRDPIAMFYLNLGMRQRKVDHAGEANETNADEFYQQFKPRGLANAEFSEKLDDIFSPGAAPPNTRIKSAWFSITLNKNGAPDARSDLATAAEFQTVLDFTAWKLRSLASDLAQGRITPHPSRAKQKAACDQCNFACLCPFDRVRGTYRELPEMKRDVAITAMRQAIEAK